MAQRTDLSAGSSPRCRHADWVATPVGHRLRVKLGRGIIFERKVQIAANTKIGDFATILSMCVIGHDVTIGSYTLIPNPFWGGVLFPLLVFAFLFLWPTIERRRLGDDEFHNLLDRPRDVPWRTAVGAAVFSFVSIVFLAGAMDRVAVSVGVPYTWQVWIFRAGLVVVPAIVFVATKRICSELRDRSWSEVEPSVARE